MAGTPAARDLLRMTEYAAPTLTARAPRRSGDGRLRAVLTTAARDAAFLTLGLLTSVVAFGVWVAGVTITLSLALFLVGLPVFLATAYTFRWTAELDRRNAALVTGRTLRGRYRASREPGFWALLKTRAGDPRTWKDMAWLVSHSFVGFAFGVVAVTTISAVVGTLFLPAWYWALPEGGLDFGLWMADTLPEAAASALLAIPAAALTIGALRVMALAESTLAVTLLDD
jgi:Putative sensor